MHGLAVQRVGVGALETFTDLRGDPDRAKVVGGDQADDAVDRRRFPGPSQRRGRSLGGQAAAPARPVKDPAEIDAGPGPLRMVKTDTADHVSRLLLDDRPLTVAAPLPL